MSEEIKSEHIPETEAKEPKKNKTGKIIGWIVTGFFVALVAGLGGFKIYQKVSGDTAIFGSQYPVVLTDSMEPVYNVDDVLIVKNCGPEDVKEGDDISFYWDLANSKEPTNIKADGVYMMTHRLESIEYFEDASENDGYHYTFTTHGINTQSDQCGGGDCTYQKQVFHEKVLIGKVTGKSGFLRVMNKVLTSVWTLIILILIPCLYLMISTVVDMIKKLNVVDEEEKGENKASNNHSLDGLTPEQKEKLKKQMLEELLNKGGKK